MAYKAKDQFFPAVIEGNVKTSGSSLTLAVGEVAFVDISKTTKTGVKILSDFTPLDPSAKLAIRMGEPKDNTSRSEDNKSISTIPFKIQDVVSIYTDAPDRAGILVDDFTIGFNGADGSEIDLENAENEVLEVCLKGDLMGMIGLPDSKHVARINLTAPIEGTKGTDWTMHEIVENAYLALKDYKLPGNIPITEYVDILLVNSENPATIPGTSSTFYSLMLSDEGTYSELGKVQAQYDGLDIKRLQWEAGVSTYSVVGTSSPTAYQGKADFILKGCDTCPTGYTAIAQGFVYEVSLENDGADQTATIQALPGATALSAVLNDINGDVATYSVVTDNALTEAEIATFITANATANVMLIAEDVTDLCTTATPSTIAWVAGESCNSTTQAYSITLKDTECGDSRLSELQAAFSDLTIAEVATTLDDCQRTYTTTVGTNLICEECGDIFRDVFVSEAPEGFDGIAWTKTPKTYSATAKMGIRVKGKRASIAGNEFMRDDMFFFDGSVEISLVGGYQTYTNESYLAGTNERFTVKYFSRKADAQNLGGNLRKYEEEAQMHFRGRTRYMGNNYGKIVNGQETRLEALEQYITYSITIAPNKFVSNFQQAQNGAFTYHFIVQLGKQEAMEAILNKLASAAGLAQVQAVSK
jgi:hypothetical protein